MFTFSHDQPKDTVHKMKISCISLHLVIMVASTIRQLRPKELIHIHIAT